MEEALAHVKNSLESEAIPFEEDENRFLIEQKYYDDVKALFMFFIKQEGEELILKIDEQNVSIIFN